MLVYEKIGSDSKRHLFGSESGIPTSTDTQVTYKDASGAAVTDLTVNTQLMDDGNGGMVRVSDNKAIKAFVGSKQIIPASSEEVLDEVVEDEPEEQVNAQSDEDQEEQESEDQPEE